MTQQHGRTSRYLLSSSLTALTLAFAAGATSASAQPVDTATAQPKTAISSEEIVITGTRRSDRTVTNSPSPIDVISSQELTTQPTANLLDTVKNIVPSFFVVVQRFEEWRRARKRPAVSHAPAE